MIVRQHRRHLLVALALSTFYAGTTGCKDTPDSGEASAGPARANRREAVFRVEGMTCASCNVTVKLASERVRGVQSARADSVQGRAWVTFDPAATTPVQIAAAISETGYKATPLGGNRHE